MGIALAIMTLMDAAPILTMALGAGLGILAIGTPIGIGVGVNVALHDRRDSAGNSCNNTFPERIQVQPDRLSRKYASQLVGLSLKLISTEEGVAGGVAHFCWDVAPDRCGLLTQLDLHGCHDGHSYEIQDGRVRGLRLPNKKRGWVDGTWIKYPEGREQAAKRDMDFIAPAAALRTVINTFGGLSNGSVEYLVAAARDHVVNATGPAHAADWVGVLVTALVEKDAFGIKNEPTRIAGVVNLMIDTAIEAGTPTFGRDAMRNATMQRVLQTSSLSFESGKADMGTVQIISGAMFERIRALRGDPKAEILA